MSSPDPSMADDSSNPLRRRTRRSSVRTSMQITPPQAHSRPPHLPLSRHPDLFVCYDLGFFTGSTAFANFITSEGDSCIPAQAEELERLRCIATALLYPARRTCVLPRQSQATISLGHASPDPSTGAFTSSLLSCLRLLCMWLPSSH